MSLRVFVKSLFDKFPLIDGLFRRFIWSRLYFPEIEMRSIDSLASDAIDVAVDVGAAHGSYAWILNRKSRTVLCFEPGVDHGAYLERCIFGTNIQLVRSAVGDRNKKVQMYTPGSNSEALHSATLSLNNPIAVDLATKVHEVDQICLDSFLPKLLEISRTIDLIKVDVEGYELEVFKGAREVLSRHYPVIFCEIEKRHNSQCDLVFNFLHNLGYQSFFYRNGSYHSFIGHTIESLQSLDDLQVRLSREYIPDRNMYINNFVFQHHQSKLNLCKLK